MFTGIIEEVGTIKQIQKNPASAVLTIAADTVLEQTKIGDSIAVNGVCLTVTDLKAGSFTADVMHETLRRSSLGSVRTGSPVNLERAMQLTGKTKFKTELFGFSIQKNPPAVVIDNEEDIPKEYYIPQDPKLDRTAIKKFLKDNEVSWAHLQQGESLRIR